MTYFFFYFQYFSKYTKHWASDPEGSTDVGDFVYMKKLKQPASDRVHHYIKEVVFKLGAVVDPITGKRCRGTEYVEDDARKFGPLFEEFKPKSS